MEDLVLEQKQNLANEIQERVKELTPPDEDLVESWGARAVSLGAKLFTIEEMKRRLEDVTPSIPSVSYALNQTYRTVQALADPTDHYEEYLTGMNEALDEFRGNIIYGV